MKKILIILIFVIPVLACCQTKPKATTTNKNMTSTDPQHPNNPYYSRTDTTKLHVPNSEWKKILPADVYAVAREQGTERAFTGQYWDFTGLGNYYCAVCGNPLFRADQKFASSCGWPSFFEPIRKNSVEYRHDKSYGMERTEVLCARCESHLGHVFNDGPPPTGMRFCMNSTVLEFVPNNPLSPKK